MSSSVKRYLEDIRSCLRLRPFDTSTSGGRSKERYRRVILATLSSALAKAISIGALLISTPLTVRYLSSEQFGLWMTISSLIVLMGFSDLGIGNGLLNVIAQAHGREDRVLAQQAVTSSMVLLVIISLIIAVLFWAAFPFIDWGYLFNTVEPIAIRESGEATAVLVACISVNLPLLVAQKVQLGYQEGLQANMWQALGSIVMLFGILLAVYLNAGLPWLVLAAAGGPVTAMCLNWLYQFLVRRRWLLPRRQNFERNVARRVGSQGLIWTVFQLMAFIGTGADLIIASHIFGAHSIGSYAVMSKLLSGLLIAQMLSAPLWPAFAEALERRDIEWVRRTFHRSQLLFAMLGLFGALVMGFASFWIVRIWVGPELVPSPLMAGGFALWSFITNYFAAIAAIMSNNHMISRLLTITCAAAISSFLLKFMLAKIMGIEGIIWASVIGYGTVCTAGTLWLWRHLDYLIAEYDSAK